MRRPVLNSFGLVLALATVAVLFGTVARFADLNAKLFWQDEAISALRVSGHTVAEYQALFDGHAHPASAMFAMQRLAPDRPLSATVASIAVEEPQRSLAYYVGVRLWAKVFGDGVAALRAFSALLGVIGIALGFWLGRTMTRAYSGGVVLAALIAVSPFQVRYSQQVREFVFFADCTMLACALFLRAANKPSPARWMAFALSAALGLYSDLQFTFVLAALGFAALLQWPRQLGAYGASVAFAGLLFAPWLGINVHLWSRTSLALAWAASPYSLGAFAVKWAFNLGAVFFDADLAYVALGPLLIPIFALVGFAAVRLVREHYRVADTVTLVLLLSTSLPLIVADFVRHAHYETAARYEVPTWIGVETLVMFTIVLFLRSDQRRLRVLGVAAFAYLIACGMASVAVQRGVPMWWDNNERVDEIAVAGALPADGRASVAAERSHAIYVLVLSRYLAPETRLLLVDLGMHRPSERVPYPGYAFVPTSELRARLATGCAAREFWVAARPPTGACALGERVTLSGVATPQRDIVPRLDRASETYGLVSSNALWRVAASPADVRR